MIANVSGVAPDLAPAGPDPSFFPEWPSGNIQYNYIVGTTSGHLQICLMGIRGLFFANNQGVFSDIHDIVRRHVGYFRGADVEVFAASVYITNEMDTAARQAARRRFTKSFFPSMI